VVYASVGRAGRFRDRDGRKPFRPGNAGGCFQLCGIGLEWQGSGIEEKAVVTSIDTIEENNVSRGDAIIEIDPRYFRLTELNDPQADIRKARTQLKWEPRITISELIEVMVDYDLKMVGIEPSAEGINACRAKGFCYTDHAYSFYEKVREGVWKVYGKGSKDIRTDVLL